MSHGEEQEQHDKLQRLLREGVALRDPIWVTRDGLRVPVSQMDDRHLLNTIRVLRGHSPIGTTFRCDDVTRRDWINVMANEAYKRGLLLEGPREGDPVHE